MATTSRDYYEVLGIGRDADLKAVRDAFRQLALKYHPDRNKEPGAEERFKEIAEAYAVLSDPEKRREYDAGGAAGLAGFSAEDLFAGTDFGDLFGGTGFDFGGGLFDRFFRRQPSGPRRGANIEIALGVRLERIVSGGEETVEVRRPQRCEACQGSGAKPGTAPRRCDQCDGSGRRVSSKRQEGLTVQQITTCQTCHGRGTIIDETCPACRGVGEVETAETLTVTIPIGAEEGLALRIPGHGMPSQEAGGEPGDLFVIVRALADERFRRRGADLWRAESLTVAEAVLGTSLNVPTLERPTEVTVPAGTQPGAILRLSGKGLPRFGGGGRGDLYLEIRVQVPERIGPEERELYERLRALERVEREGARPG